LQISVSQTQRHARHILSDEVGGHGRLRLLGASVRVAGTGAAADEAAPYLVEAGVGTVVVEAELLAEHGEAWPGLSGGVGAHATHQGRSGSRLEDVQAALRILVAMGVEGGS
jgi:hypothetical protein